MKILILSTAYPLRGGIAHYNALLARSLSAHHDVSTITFKRQYPSFLFPGKSQEEQGDTSGAILAPQWIDSVNPFNWLAVGRKIRRQHPDLIIFKYWMPFFAPCFGTIARVAKRKCGTRVLAVCDNVIPHEHRPFDRLFTRFFFGSVDYFLVQSRAVERDLVSFWPGAVYRYAPHPVYDIFGEALPKCDARNMLGITAKHVLLFFGYVRRYKGLHVLFEAMALLIRQMDVHLLVVGEFYEDERPYREQIAALGLERHVTMNAGYICNDQVGRYFSAADAVVLPYLSATQSGIAQIAFNFHLPIIASNVGGLAEVIREGETGFTVPPGDVAALAGAIRRLFVETDKTVMRKALDRAKNEYSWENLTGAIVEMAGGKEAQN